MGPLIVPSFLPAKDDNSVGDSINGSSGTPTNYYANPALNFYVINSPTVLSNLRISWASVAVKVFASDLYFYNSQFVNCLNGFQGSYNTFYLRNTLFANVLTNFYVNDIQVDAQNSTFAGSSCVGNAINSTALLITNCVFANIGVFATNASYSVAAGFNGFYNCAGIWILTSKPTTVLHFKPSVTPIITWTSGCAFHALGTTNIDPGLLDELPNTTTYPPFVFSNQVISVATNLGIYATRDNIGNPDLGYTYDPVDFVFGGCDLYSNVTLQLEQWWDILTRLGIMSSSGQLLWLFVKRRVIFPLQKVQHPNLAGSLISKMFREGSGGWSDSGWMGAIMLNGNGVGATPQINSTFTKWGRPSTLFSS